MSGLSQNESDDLAAARAEIEAFHVFLEGWFTGTWPSDDAGYATLADSLREDFSMITPAGLHRSRQQLLGGFRPGHGTNPDFRIEIRAVEHIESNVDSVLVRYQEWQWGAINSTPPDNARWGTVLFARDAARPHGLRWKWLHETSLPVETA